MAIHDVRMCCDKDNIASVEAIEKNRIRKEKKLLLHGIENYGVIEVTVNQQNPQAIGFYKHMGFETYKRTDFDEEGNPYPLLYMGLKR